MMEMTVMLDTGMDHESIFDKINEDESRKKQRSRENRKSSACLGKNMEDTHTDHGTRSDGDESMQHLI